jgi:peptidyl-prolyl cis-trans isomerase D
VSRPFVAPNLGVSVLEKIVQKFRGVVLLLIVLGLSAVFALQFGGPQAQGCNAPGSGGAVAAVYGQDISRNELQSAYLLVGGEDYPDELARQHKLRDMVLYGLIERELLAREARELGYRVTEEEVLERVAEDGVLYRSMSVDAGDFLPPSGALRVQFEDSKGKFSKDNLKNFIQYRLRRSVREFTRSQINETLAQRMRETVTASVAISPGEVWDAYVREKESAQLKYVRFAAAYYGQTLSPTAQEIANFIAANAADVDAEYERQKPRYTALEKQVRARHILIKVDSGADEETKQAARARSEALLKRARAGEDFAELARKHSQDEGSAKKGGDLGFNPKGRMVTPFDDAQFALEPGQISDVVESTFGFHVIKVEQVREGDVPLDEAKREIADKMLRDRRAAELAKQKAAELHEKVQGGTSLEDAVAALGGKAAADPDAVDDPLAPAVRETRPFGRTGTPIPGPFDSTPLVKAAYELSEDAPLGAAPIQLGDDWFVYRLESRTLADKDGFTPAEQQRIGDGLLARKRAEVLEAFVRDLRAKAMNDKAILVEETAAEQPQPTS